MDDEIVNGLILSASKERFIKPLYDTYGIDGIGLTENEISYLDKVSDLPEAVIKWVDSGSADKLKLDWQTKDKESLWKKILTGFVNYKLSGGSRKEQKQYKKQNLYSLFDGYNVNLLKKLENDKFIFAQPLDYEAAKFMDSFECGGQGAKWCIGYEKTDEYWEHYTESGTEFILALSKNPNSPQDELKYMIELGEDNCKAWVQYDDPDECILSYKFLDFFGHDYEEFYEAIDKDISLVPYIDKDGNCILSNSITEIEDNAFYGYDNLESIIIPSSVTKIGEWAFYRCENLKSVVIPNSVIKIGEGAFFDCTHLESISIPGSVTKIEGSVFSGCKRLKSIDIPDSVTYIGEGAFFGCDNLKSIDIPNSVIEICRKAFVLCENLESIIIPDSVTKIGKEVFVKCPNLKSITIPDNLVNDIIKDLPDDCLINGKPKGSYIKNNFRRRRIMSALDDLYENGTRFSDEEWERHVNQMEDSYEDDEDYDDEFPGKLYFYDDNLQVNLKRYGPVSVTVAAVGTYYYDYGTYWDPPSEEFDIDEMVIVEPVEDRYTRENNPKLFEQLDDKVADKLYDIFEDDNHIREKIYDSYEDYGWSVENKKAERILKEAGKL